jgi:hypothetical protein
MFRKSGACAPFSRFGGGHVSQGKIEPLIDEARKRAHAQSHAELQAFIEDIDARFYVLERDIDEKIEQIQARLRKLEEGVEAPLSD